jgi:hypothetical protein
MKNQEISGMRHFCRKVSLTELTMSRVKSPSFLLCMVVMVFGGCAKQQQSETVEQICVGNLDKARAMQIAEDVLEEMRFSIEKSDIEQGFIRTKPLPGTQFFEFWRKDSIGNFNWAESNLQSIRRIVEMDVSQEVNSTGSPQKGQLCISCDVSVQRLNLPERLLHSIRSYDVFSQSSDPVRQKLRLDKEQKVLMTWVDLGRDELLETEILKRIENKAAGLQKGK